MGVLTEHRHDFKFFESIPDLCPAIKEFSGKNGQPFISKLGNIFVKHDVFNEFGLVVVHRHFDLKFDEILVETMSSDETVSVAFPWTVQDEKATPTAHPLWTSLDLEERELVIPQTWCFVSRDELKAFEYCSSEENLSNPPSNFVSELFDELMKIGLENIVGVRRVSSFKASWETTDEGVRASVTRFGVKPEDVEPMGTVSVGWRFNEKGEVPRDGSGTSDCGSCNNCTNCRHCNHCRHCIMCPWKPF